tara:strand:+ start:221 stop:514 length:294 start_codon:yes stop_codon:yes gene_type:complete
MKKEKWSEFERYIVLTDNSKMEMGGTYIHFLNFKKIVEVIRNIAHSDKSSYLYNGNIYSREITSTDAQKILLNIETCTWMNGTHLIKTVANQVGLQI